jgi:hypothetical protein
MSPVPQDVKDASKADGYAVVLDDKGSPYGYWFVGAWNTQESAEIALKGQKGNGRIVPLYFRPEAVATMPEWGLDLLSHWAEWTGGHIPTSTFAKCVDEIVAEHIVPHTFSTSPMNKEPQ